MDRATKIATIQARRSENAAKTESLGEHLADVETALLELERVRRDLLTKVEADEPKARLAELAPALRDLTDKVALERAALNRALARLRRMTLNIGVVGRARQGKSRFLQSLTGLSNREIPDGSGHFCTGTPSMIRHIDGHTYADVYYHSERSFLDEVVGPYYAEYGLGAPPVSPRAFGSEPLPPLPAKPSPQAESAYAHLSRYHETFAEYGTLIGRPSPERVGDDQIRRFVAQDDLDGKPSHTFRAVRRVEIATRFEQTDLAGVAVIDLPGLGDTNLGDSQILLSALEDDVDIVLFLRRPNPEGDGIHEFDIDLYGIARNALPEIPMERRSFLILNHRSSVDQDNLVSARAYEALVANSPIRVAGVRITDCSKTDEVVAAFDPIVDYLVDNIESLDEVLIAERTRRAGEIDREVALLVKQASSFADLAQPGDKSYTLFLDLFRETYANLAVGVKELVAEFRAERDSPEPVLGLAVADVLARARVDDGVPTVEEIVRRVAVEGSNVAAFSKLLDENRAHLSRRFLELDDALHQTVQRMWDRIAETLREQGELGHLSERTGREFLLELIDLIGQVRTDGGSEIRYALEIVTSFGLSYRGFFQHRIRPCLDGMNPDLGDTIRPKESSTPKEIRELIDIAYQEALFECETALAKLLKEPNGAVFAIVEEFKDRVLRSARTMDEWQAFYQPFRAEIWSGKFAALAAETVHLRTWNQALQRLKGTP